MTPSKRLDSSAPLHFISALREQNHVLTRVILQEILSLSDRVTLTRDNLSKIESLGTTLLSLHGDMEQLFLSSFATEMVSVKNLAAVMRERSVSVRVLQEIWKSHNLSEILLPVFSFISSLSLSRLATLTAPFSSATSSARREKMKKKLVHSTLSLLSPDLVPLTISILAHWCVEIAYSCDDLELEDSERDKSKINQWAVGALIFLRFYIPPITSLAVSSSSSDVEKKGAILMGRYLMKLCCKSRFSEYPNSLLNEVIDELIAAGTFDKYCDDVVTIGSENEHLSLTSRTPRVSQAAEMRGMLYDFILSIIGSNVASLCADLSFKDRNEKVIASESSRSEGVTVSPIDDQSSIQTQNEAIFESLFNRFKLELTSQFPGIESSLGSLSFEESEPTITKANPEGSATLSPSKKTRFFRGGDEDGVTQSKGTKVGRRKSGEIQKRLSVSISQKFSLRTNAVDNQELQLDEDAIPSSPSNTPSSPLSKFLSSPTSKVLSSPLAKPQFSEEVVVPIICDSFRFSPSDTSSSALSGSLPALLDAYSSPFYQSGSHTVSSSIPSATPPPRPKIFEDIVIPILSHNGADSLPISQSSEALFFQGYPPSVEDVAAPNLSGSFSFPNLEDSSNSFSLQEPSPVRRRHPTFKLHIHEEIVVPSLDFPISGGISTHSPAPLSSHFSSSSPAVSSFFHGAVEQIQIPYLADSDYIDTKISILHKKSDTDLDSSHSQSGHGTFRPRITEEIEMPILDEIDLPKSSRSIRPLVSAPSPHFLTSRAKEEAKSPRPERTRILEEIEFPILDDYPSKLSFQPVGVLPAASANSTSSPLSPRSTQRVSPKSEGKSGSSRVLNKSGVHGKPAESSAPKISEEIEIPILDDKDFRGFTKSSFPSAHTNSSSSSSLSSSSGSKAQYSSPFSDASVGHSVLGRSAKVTPNAEPILKFAEEIEMPILDELPTKSSQPVQSPFSFSTSSSNPPSQYSSPFCDAPPSRVGLSEGVELPILSDTIAFQTKSGKGDNSKSKKDKKGNKKS